LHEHLREWLPEYMRPWAYVVLDKFPPWLPTASWTVGRCRCQSLTARPLHRITWLRGGISSERCAGSGGTCFTSIASAHSRQLLRAGRWFGHGSSNGGEAAPIVCLGGSRSTRVRTSDSWAFFSAVLQDLAAAAARDAQTPSPAANVEQSDMEAALAAIESISEERLLSGGDSSGSAE